MDDDTRVEWHEWDKEPFAVAERAGKPVLLSLTATWCRSCAEMDELTYSEPRIAANINDGFVPVRVDVDRQPRVRDRYSMGGFPSTVFLTPSGTVLTGAGYLGPDGMRDVLDAVRKRWDGGGEDAGTVPRSLRDDPTPAGELTEDIEARLVGQLREAYDDVNGGWGDGAKYPMPRTVEFALKRERKMAVRTLDAISVNLLDDHGGGFFRHATADDWADPRREKVLDTNAALVRAFANAYLLTGREEYREPARTAIEYLTTTMWVDDPTGLDGPGAFAASQTPEPEAVDAASRSGDRNDSDPSTVDRDDSHSATGDRDDSHSATGDRDDSHSATGDRDDSHSATVDQTVLADWNALAVDALLTYHAYTDDDRARRYAIRAFRTLRSELVDDGQVVHYPDWTASERGLLVDHARVIRACCTARQVLGPAVQAVPDADASGGEKTAQESDALGSPVETATALAEYALSELRPGGAAFVDGPASGPALLDRPFRPLDGNVELAEALLDLDALTGEDRYRSAARDALAAFAGASDRFGPAAAPYGNAVSRLLGSDLRIELTAPAGSDLHRAALRIADPDVVVVPAVTSGDVRDANVDEPEAAFVVVDGERGPPATDPETLSEQVRRRAAAR